MITIFYEFFPIFFFQLNSFKTKGNLTKHMKSKTHYKKLAELGIKPLPNSVEEDYEDQEDSSVTSSGGERIMNNADGEDDSDLDEMSDVDDGHESSGKCTKKELAYRKNSNF